MIINGEITTPYESFIAKSRYSRWLEEENRRETWEETVDRYIDFMSKTDHGSKLDSKFWTTAREAILNLDVMPSMRALMTAGPALERENLAGYNCSFLAVDDTRAFDEALYILMNGTGLGYSIETKYVSQLPDVPANIVKSSNVITVGDSKAGWARAFRQLIEALYRGEQPRIDVSKVRAPGARLKTFGGRASGPQPLVDLFSFTIERFQEAAGRKLSPLEAHRIMCKVGDVVVVGGVRRSALISLSDIGDYDMAKAKSGAWWESMPELALANNSAVYTKKPSIGQFLTEWGHLYESKSGERGIFNLDAALRNPDNRRDWSKIAGTNPCGEILLRSKGLCNLTEVIVKESDSLEDLKHKAEIATVLGTVQASLTNFKYVRKAWIDNAEDERLLGVSMTGQFGHSVLSGYDGKDKLIEWLTDIRAVTRTVNDDVSAVMGIKPSAAITTVKPSGTVSQLTNSSAGMHPWHSEFYIRTVRQDNKDPLTAFLKSTGVHNEPDVMKPDDTTVFSFPIAAPPGAVTRNEMPALMHLDVWQVYKQHWTDHNPSVTINVREDEWIEVANWVYENWDTVGGLSFLPHTDHTYKQAPYQEVTKEIYDEFKSVTPETIDWSFLPFFETEDTTTGTQQLACVSGSCDVIS